MKKILIGLIAIFMMNGSTIQAFGNEFLFNYSKTNIVKIEESIQGIDIDGFIADHLEKDELLIIRSIEQDVDFVENRNSSGKRGLWYYTTSQLDWGTKYLIEDNLITKLKESGYRVLERDPELLEHLYSESTDRFALYNLNYILNASDSEDDEIKKEGALDRESFEEYLKNTDESDKEQMQKFRVLMDLSAADKLLSYRVLECGVFYGKPPKDRKNVIRLARTRLHCRLEDTKTSEILASGLLEWEVADTIPKAQIESLIAMHYKSYYHTLPNIEGNAPGYLKEAQPTKKDDASRAKKNKMISYFISAGAAWVIYSIVKG